jgi:hypothetical protein
MDRGKCAENKMLNRLGGGTSHSYASGKAPARYGEAYDFASSIFLCRVASEVKVLRRTGQILREYTALNEVVVSAKVQSDACEYAGHGRDARATFSSLLLVSQKVVSTVKIRL